MNSTKISKATESLIAQHRREIAARDTGFALNAIDRARTQALFPVGAAAVVVPKADIWFRVPDLGDEEASVIASTLSNKPRDTRWSQI